MHNPTAVDVAAFLDSLIAHGMSEHTYKAYTTDIKGFLIWKDAHPQGECTLARCAAEYLNDGRKTWAAATTKRKVASLKKFCVFMGDLDALAEYKAPKVGTGIAHPLPGGITDIQEMMAWARRPHHKAMIILIGLMGLRISEARGVRVQDFDDSAGDIVLRVRGKGDKTRILPVDPAIMAMLDECFLIARSHPEGILIPIGDRPARRAWTRIGRRAGLTRSTATHDGRMTFGTAAYDKEKDIRAVQELLGHASMDTTQRYTGVSMASKRKSAKVF